MNEESTWRDQVRYHETRITVMLSELGRAVRQLEFARLAWLDEQTTEWQRAHPHHLTAHALDQQVLEARRAIGARADRLRVKIDEIRDQLHHLSDEEIVL